MSKQKPAKSDIIYLRVVPGTKQRLFEAAARFGEPTDVLREVLQALIDGRLSIIPPNDQKESLYVPRNQD